MRQKKVLSKKDTILLGDWIKAPVLDGKMHSNAIAMVGKMTTMFQRK